MNRLPFAHSAGSHIGMPAKSGVGGGTLAVLPGQAGLAVFSPPLDDHGNSVRGVETCRRLSRDMEMHFVRAARSGRSMTRSAKVTSSSVMWIASRSAFSSPSAATSTSSSSRWPISMRRVGARLASGPGCGWR